MIMAVLMVKGKNDNYKYKKTDPQIIEIYLRYITRTRSTDQYPAAYVNYIGFRPYATIEELISDFHQTQMVYGCNSGIRARHEWISFAEGETVDIKGVDRIVDIANMFALWYYNQGFEVVYAVHTDSEYNHVHYVLNSVNFITGKKYHSNRNVLYHERLFLDGLVRWLTGKTATRVNLAEYADDTYELVNEELLLQQRYMPVLQFAYENGPRLVYEA